MRRSLRSMSDGGVSAGLPGCRAMGSVARPCWTRASSKLVTPLCTLLTCGQQHIAFAHLSCLTKMHRQHCTTAFSVTSLLTLRLALRRPYLIGEPVELPPGMQGQAGQVGF